MGKFTNFSPLAYWKMPPFLKKIRCRFREDCATIVAASREGMPNLLGEIGFPLSEDQRNLWKPVHGDPHCERVYCPYYTREP